jgi:hypothetical protein
MLEALSNINRQIYSEYLPSARAEREAQDDTPRWRAVAEAAEFYRRTATPPKFCFSR